MSKVERMLRILIFLCYVSIAVAAFDTYFKCQKVDGQFTICGCMDKSLFKELK